MMEEVTCPFPVGKILGEISRAYPLMVETLSGAQLEDTEKCPPSQKILGGVCGLKMPGELPTQWKDTGGGID